MPRDAHSYYVCNSPCWQCIIISRSTSPVFSQPRNLCHNPVTAMDYKPQTQMSQYNVSPLSVCVTLLSPNVTLILYHVVIFKKLNQNKAIPLSFFFQQFLHTLYIQLLKQLHNFISHCQRSAVQADHASQYIKNIK